MELEVGVSEHSHFRTVETFDLDFLVDSNRCDEIADFKPHVGHHEAEHRYYHTIDDLHEELGKIAIEQTAHAVGAIELNHLFPHHTVPACAVRSIGKDPDRQHAPEAVDAVDRDRTDGIVNAARLKEENALDYQKPRDGTNHHGGPRINKGAGRRDSDQARQHAIAH